MPRRLRRTHDRVDPAFRLAHKFRQILFPTDGMTELFQRFVDPIRWPVVVNGLLPEIFESCGSGGTETKKVITLLVVATSLPLWAQGLNNANLQTPRPEDGMPDLTAPPPRLNGKPDLSGVWQADRTPASEFTRVLGSDVEKLQVDLNDVGKHFLNVFWGVNPEKEPLRPEGASILKRRAQTPADRPMTRCLPIGVPAVAFAYAFKMVQAPQEIVILSETADPPRQIYTDGRSLPRDPEPSWMGYSVAKWEGDTLVVDTTGFTERSWLDGFGHPRSESMHITERYRRRDFGHIDMEVTFEDPKYYTKPFQLKAGLTLIPDSDVFEFVCQENERDLVHLVK
jgi:hypothetical protein